MKTRQFWGKDMEEALRSVRAALGADALILGSKSVRSENGSGVEVTTLDGPGQSLDDRFILAKHGEGELKEVRQQLVELKTLLSWLIRSMGQTRVFKELLARGVSSDVIAVLAQEIGAEEGAVDREQVRHILSRLIRVGGHVEFHDKRSECLAFFGPTGVGKTTTVIKLTVCLLQQRSRRIGWIGLDGHRIAGTELLGVYAGILGVPWEVVESGSDLQPALERLSGCDLLLLDTAGISPWDHGSLDELARVLQDIPDLKRFLVLSAATNSGDMGDWLKAYERVGFDSIVFTKMDECRYPGHLVNVAVSCERPLSYITNGQRATNGLEMADSQKLAALLLPDEKEAAKVCFVGDQR